MTLRDASNLAAVLESSYRRHGEKPAIISPRGTATYLELAERAHAITATLGRDEPAGIGFGVPVVAVVLDRSPEFVATVLGVLAAGAVYLPLDPAAPDAYLRAVFAEVRPMAVVTSPTHAERLAAITRARILTAADSDVAAGAPGAFRQSSAEPEDPAYVIYTSGSTGAPKGVLVPHRAMLNSTAARIDLYGAPGRVPLLHSPAFDLTSGVLFWALLAGGTLVIDPVELVDIAGTLDLVHARDVTHLVYPASLYGTFLDRAALAPPTRLSAVMIGSERWSPVLIDRHRALLPETSLFNEYGPTEACVCSSYACVYDATTKRSAPLTIGRPIQHTGYQLVDHDGHPTDGGRGELAITGRNLALGYLNRPDLTGQRFPMLLDGQRAYRTGDLAELSPAGDYVLLDRVDRQIQVGGHRVEPGHIETVLMGHPEIAQAHVVGRGASPDADPSTLVAYLVPRSTQQAGAAERTGSSATSDELTAECERYLRQRIPSYLVPAVYVVLDELPRTPAGKIDRHRLPFPAATVTGIASVGGHGDRDVDVQPADPLERSLAVAVAEILGVPVIGIDTPLTTLGASSLMFVRLAALIGRDHRVEVAISALFTAPTITAVAALVRAAIPSDRPRLRARAQGDGAQAMDGEAFPLSGQQEQIWVLDQMAPDALAYSTQFSLRLSGPLDVAALQEALSRVVARHEILRTTFHDGLGGPVQVVHDPWPVELDVIDLTALDGPAQARELDGRMRAAVSVGFDVASLPLVRWYLYCLGPDSWTLLQVEHHFAHDGWSAQVFLAEIRDTYAAILAGVPPRLADLPIQYRDYAAWYQKWRGSGDFAAQVEYWRAQMAGAPVEGATFAPDRPRPPRQTFRGACLRAEIPTETVAGLDALATQHGVSRFAVFLAAFALQVWHHTDQHDLVIGSALANRRQAETAPLLGMFVNALPLRLAVDPTATVADLLRATMATLLGAQDHQELPLLELLTHLDLPRDPGRNPLFSLMFAFHDTPRPDFRVGRLSGEVVIEHNGSAKNDLNVVCVPNLPGPDTSLTHAGVTVLWEYNSDLFDASTARALLAGFTRILEVLLDTAECVDTPLRELDLLGSEETCRILAEGRGPHHVLPFANLHAGFDAALAAHPQALALEHAGAAWTYVALDTRARMLEQHLATLLVRPGMVVAVGCPSGLDLVAVLLAILRLGAAYVCIDPQHPPARVRLLLEDAGASVVVTTSQAASGLGRASMPVLLVDDLAHGPSFGAPTPRPEVSADAPAYLVYTSGSTGAPKAIVATHRNAVAAAHARTLYFHPGRAAQAPRTLITLPPIFDVAASMMFWTLFCGGTIIFPGASEHARDPEQVRALVEWHRVTHVNFVASFHRQLLLALPVGWGRTLRVVAIGGEACGSDLVREHAVRLPDVALHNEYGPSEATVWCSAAQVHPPRPGSGRVSVGRPLANTSMVVLRPDGQIAPVGAVGELHIGGAGVAAGYHRRPDLTAERFVTLGGSLDGQRLYRTGDYARLTSEGEFEILGRLDDQVKVRGHRVELGEVTACLLAHPGVTVATVLLDGAADAGQLVAYVAASRLEPDLPDLGARLRSWVAARLPAFMAPAAYVVLDELPRTTSGKIDRQQLPHLDRIPAAMPALDGCTPVTARQEHLLNVWREQLLQPGLGIDDDFFASGGDSLQAIRAATRSRALGIPVLVSQLLTARTVRALDGLLGPTGPADRGASPASTTGRRPPGTRLAPTPIQGWFFAQDFTDPDHFHQARLFDVDEASDGKILHAALAWTINRHDAFRTYFTSTDGVWVPVLSDGPIEDIIGEDTLPPCEATAAAARLHPLLEGIHRDLGIAAGRLARFTFLSESDGTRRWLYAAIHHLVIDAVSWQLLVDDIEAAYRSLSAGLEPPGGAAPGLPAAGHPASVHVGEGEHAAYWRRLAHAPKPLLRGTGPPGPPAVVADRVHAQRRLSVHATRYLRHDAPRLQAIGTYPLLLAALRRALEPLSDRPGLYAWLEGHGRDRTAGIGGVWGSEGVVGWLTVLYPALLAPHVHPDMHPEMHQDQKSGRLVDVATAIQEHLAGVPDGGEGYARARYLHPNSRLGRLLGDIDPPQVTVNYLGHHQPTDPGRVLRPATEPAGQAIGAANVLPTPVDLTVAPDPDRVLAVTFSLDPGFLAPATIEDFTARFVAEVEASARLIALSATPKPGARTLYLVHPVGGSVDWYAPLARALGPDWDCYALPHDGGADLRTVPDLAAAYLDRIRAAQPCGPYTLAGWSFGAAVAYEMARHAQAAPDAVGDRLAELVLLDPPGPLDGVSAARVLMGHVRALLPASSPQVLADAVARTADLPSAVRTTELTAILESGGAYSGGESEREALIHRLGILLACHAALAAWRPGGQVPDLRLVLPSDAHAAGQDELLQAWRARGHGGIAVTTVPGDHRTMLAEPGVEQVAACLRAHAPTASGGW